jgi:hypothetical protein
MLDEITTNGKTNISSLNGNLALNRPAGTTITNDDTRNGTVVGIHQGSSFNGSSSEAVGASTNDTSALGVYSEGTCYLNNGTQINVSGGSMFESPR